jgi:hypothetical protein
MLNHTSTIPVCAVLFAVLIAAALGSHGETPDTPDMYFTDSTFVKAFAKDPDVARFGGRYLMYYSTFDADRRLIVGIAESTDLTNWTIAGHIMPEGEVEKKGLGAPGVIVIDDKVHLFYQSYGNREKDAICHATSTDGIHFERNPTNPIFRPTGDWNIGRAIDADTIPFRGEMLLYFATRDPSFKTQMIGVAAAPLDSGFVRDAWEQRADFPVLKPELDWEKECIEASSVIVRKDRLYMFYGGAYNTEPQQIGVAESEDGIHWRRMSDQPLLPNGKPGSWNEHEAGHPGVFTDDDGKQYLFYQGTNDKGKTWYLSKMLIEWDEEDRPYLIRPEDSNIFRLK